MLQSDMQLAFWLRGLMELCIYPPKPGSAAGELLVQLLFKALVALSAFPF